MMLCVIIAEIFTSWAPINVKLFLADSVCEPMVSHIHCVRSFLFDHFVQDAECDGVISAERVGGCVWPSSVSLTLSGAPLWALWKHAPTSDSAAEETTFLMTEAILNIDPLMVSCSGDVLPKKKQTSELASCVGDRKVRGIAVDVQYHVGGVIPDGSVRVSGLIIQHLIFCGLRLFSCLGLLCGNIIEWH
jgi:hypothetical protein